MAGMTTVTAHERAVRYGQQPVTVLLTGLAGAGKSTIAAHLERRLFDEGPRGVRARRPADAADDQPRSRLLARRSVGESAARGRCRETPQRRRAAVYLRVPRARRGGAGEGPPRDWRRTASCWSTSRRPSRCVGRETGMASTRAPTRAKYPGYPGVTAAYEEPVDADLVLDTSSTSVEACVEALVSLMRERGALT